MEDNNEGLSFEDILTTASEITDLDELDQYVREQNQKLPDEERFDDDAVQEVIDSLSEEMIIKFGAKALEYKLDRLLPSDNDLDNLKTAKTLVKKYLLDAAPSEVDEIILLIQDKFSLKTQHKNILSKFYKEQKKKHEDWKRREAALSSGEEYDMDSVSGRAKICRDFADLYIDRQKRKNHPVKCIAGSLRLYDEGIYPESEEALAFIKNDIMEIGLDNDVNLTSSLIKQIVELIEITCPVRVEDCEPDHDHVVVLNNGVLDLRTWNFKDFDPDEVYFSKISTNYVPDAPPPTIFLGFIDACFKGNEVQKNLLQESFGYTLMKSYKYQDIFYWLGDGGNGKGSGMSILMEMIGATNYKSFSLLQLTDGANIDYNIAQLKGMYANLCGDVGKAKIVNTENIKKLSSNTDPVTGRNVREKPIQFINYAKLFFLMNRAPESEAHTTGDKRRIRVVNWINSFSEQKGEVKAIHEVIIKAGEMPGILLWAIEGLKRLEKNGEFTDDRTITQRSIEYDKKSNTMRYFIEEKVFEDPGSIVPNVMLYEEYNKYRKQVGGAELSEKELKSEFLKECKEAGWVHVTNVQKRANQLPPAMQDFLEKVMGAKSCRCFFGVSITKEEPQKTMREYVTATPDPVLASSDAEAYEAMKDEM